MTPKEWTKPVEPQRGSWSMYYTVRQYIVERGKHDGWGLFAQVSGANRSTSPIAAFANVGLGGNGLFSKRTGDEFGLAYAYTDLSEDLKDGASVAQATFCSAARDGSAT